MDSGDRPSAEDTDDGDDDLPDELGHDATDPSTRSNAEAETDDGAATDGSKEYDGDAVRSDAVEEAVDTDDSVGNEAAESVATATATTESESDYAASNPTPPGPTTAPDPEPGTAAASDADGGPIHRFLTAKRGPLMWIREMLSSAAVVLAIGLVLFAVSGVWPPMVAIESGSMEPNMEKGDLVFVTDPGRFAPDAASNDVGVVTYQQGQEVGYSTFGNPGSVIVYQQPGRVGSPIIHRARFHVEAGENWYDRADEAHLRANNCQELTNCPAPHAGFITKGDANPQYDQANGIAPPVKAEWVTGVARVRIPYLGWVRLIATGQASPLGISPGTTLFAAGASAVAVGRRSRGAA